MAKVTQFGYQSLLITSDNAEQISAIYHYLDAHKEAQHIWDVQLFAQQIKLTFRLNRFSLAQHQHRIVQLIDGLSSQAKKAPTRHYNIPISFSTEHALDLHAVCQQAGLTAQQLIAYFTTERFTIESTGFSPGFAYINHNHPKLRLPRRSNPRTKVPKGSFAISHQYCATYPSATPGGWHIIGRTPLSLFDGESQLVNWRGGDTVSYFLVSPAEFNHLLGQELRADE